MKLPIPFWNYAFATAAFTYNRMTPVTDVGNSAYQWLFGSVPNHRDLKVFGCLSFPNTRSTNPVKFMNWTSPHVFIEYSDAVKGYLCFDPKTGKIRISRDITFGIIYNQRQGDPRTRFPSNWDYRESSMKFYTRICSTTGFTDSPSPNTTSDGN